MTTTGGLTVLLGWVLFGAALGVLAYWILRDGPAPEDEPAAGLGPDSGDTEGGDTEGGDTDGGHKHP